jgi:hypothetical protein
LLQQAAARCCAAKQPPLYVLFVVEAVAEPNLSKVPLSSRDFGDQCSEAEHPKLVLSAL